MAKKQDDRYVKLDNGEMAKATFPVVVSASRSTDIPAFYADWFFHRLENEYRVMASYYFIRLKKDLFFAIALIPRLNT